MCAPSHLFGGGVDTSFEFPLLLHAELSFLETSALTGENVEEVFLKCTRTILAKIDAGTHMYEYTLSALMTPRCKVL